MKQVYKCDFCEEIFTGEDAAIAHEEKCGHNPKNRIENKLVFRLSMIFESLPRIIACALNEVAADELDYLYQEAARATSTNCPYMIKEQQGKILNAISVARNVSRKHEGRNSSTYKDVTKENPELFGAVVDTLNRAAWNEWPCPPKGE